jgi:hypothetical protein
LALATAKRFGKYDTVSHLNNSKLAVLEELSDPALKKLDAGELALSPQLGSTPGRLPATSAASLKTSLNPPKQIRTRVRIWLVPAPQIGNRVPICLSASPLSAIKTTPNKITHYAIALQTAFR